MDALAAYGSDSSSSSSSTPPAQAIIAKPKNDYSTVKEKTTVYGNHNKDDNGPSLQKRQRRWDNQTSNRSQGRLCLLPVPPLNDDSSSTSTSTSMIAWNEDYIEKQYQERVNKKSNNNDGIIAMDSTKLKERIQTKILALQNDAANQQQSQKMTRKTQQQEEHNSNDAVNKKTSSTDESNLANLLQLTHEFHNPSLLENVAKQCNISNTVTSQMMSSSNQHQQQQNHYYYENFDDFEFQILTIEEQVRIQTFQEQQQQSQDLSTTTFAQNQLSQALQKQCHQQR